MKAFSRLLILLLILSVLCSFAYMAIESEHDCHGEEDCPICRVISLLSAFFGTICLPFLFFVGFRSIRSKMSVERKRSEVVTPIDLKVKLLN